MMTLLVSIIFIFAIFIVLVVFWKADKYITSLLQKLSEKKTGIEKGSPVLFHTMITAAGMDVLLNSENDDNTAVPLRTIAELIDWDKESIKKGLGAKNWRKEQGLLVTDKKSALLFIGEKIQKIRFCRKIRVYLSHKSRTPENLNWMELLVKLVVYRKRRQARTN